MNAPASFTVFALFVLPSALGCTPLPPELLLEPDSAAAGALGERGPFGAEVQRRSLEPVGGGAVDADVFRPVDGPTEGPFPVVIFIHGGAVPPERYRWLGAHLASRGVVAAAPTHPFDLPIFAIEHAARALAGLRAATDDEDDPLYRLVDEPALVCGHSLGGVVSAKAWLAEPAFAALALFASYPDEADSFDGRAGRVVSLVGGADGKSARGDVIDGAASFDDAQVAVVDGMTHYQWADDVTEGEIESDAPPTVPDEEVRRVALTFIDGLVADVAGTAAWPFDDNASWPEGASAP